MQSSKEGMWKGYHLSIRGIRKEFLFHENLYIKGFGVDLGAEPPCTNILPPHRYPSFTEIDQIFISIISNKLALMK